MGQYGDRKGEDWRNLMHEPEAGEGPGDICLGCASRVPEGSLDEDGLCPDCEAEDDELEEMGEEEEA